MNDQGNKKENAKEMMVFQMSQYSLLVVLVFAAWLTDERSLALFPVATIVRDPHHRGCPRLREHDLKLRKT